MLLSHKSIPAVTEESNTSQMLGIASCLAAESVTVFLFSSHGLGAGLTVGRSCLLVPSDQLNNFTWIFFLGYMWNVCGGLQDILEGENDPKILIFRKEWFSEKSNLCFF